MLALVGIEPQRWILERTTIGGLLGLPDFLAGPALALVVIMIYSTWTYIGYDAVIFLAGLGNIPGELYEAARIDGASGWRIFRHITLPLLSPTVFFLSLVAIIGTFQAFTQIWILRTGAVGNRVNTASVYIFDELQNSNRYGYASSMAFVLFALILADDALPKPNHGQAGVLWLAPTSRRRPGVSHALTVRQSRWIGGGWASTRCSSPAS